MRYMSPRTTLSLLPVAIAAVLLGALMAPAYAYQGSLSSSTGGLIALGDWSNGTTLDWFVTLNPGGEDWHYKYVLSVSNKNVSHFIVEVSPSIEVGDIWNSIINGSLASVELDSYSVDSHGGSDPTIPGPLYAVKLTGDNYGTGNTIEFDSSRAPVWGDFYAVDGKNQIPAHSAWNEGFKDWDVNTPGFQDWDPTDPPSDGSVQNHVLRPDTHTNPPPIPEPCAIILAGLGFVSAAGLRRRVRR